MVLDTVLVDITPLVDVLIKLVAVALSIFLIPYLKKKNTNETNKTIAYWLEVAVGAAEEKFKDEDGKQGKNKYDFVVSFLGGMGYSLDTTKLDVLIHSNVWELINSWKEEEK